MATAVTNGVAPTGGATANGAGPSASQQTLVPASQPDQSGPSQPSQPASSSQPAASAQPASSGTAANAATGNNSNNNSNPSAQGPVPRPRDIRTMELLLTAQGVTAYEARVPQLLLDFAYRHTSSILSDAIHLSADPYTSHAGAKPSGTSGAAAMAPASGDAAVSANAIQLAIASRLAFQFRGGAGGAAAGGGLSKEWLLELARERNKVALPRVGAVEWGARLPSERFVLSGVGWGLKDAWAPGAVDDDADEEEDEELAGGGAGGGGDNDDGVDGVANGDGDVTMADANETGEAVEGGTMEDVFEDDGMMEDEEMGV